MLSHLSENSKCQLVPSKISNISSDIALGTGIFLKTTDYSRKNTETSKEHDKICVTEESGWNWNISHSLSDIVNLNYSHLKIKLTKSFSSFFYASEFSPPIFMFLQWLFKVFSFCSYDCYKKNSNKQGEITHFTWF